MGIPLTLIMKYKTFLLDKKFSTFVWLHALGCFRAYITTLIFLVILWGVTESSLSYLDMLEAEIPRMTRFSIALIIIFNILKLTQLSAIKEYLKTPPRSSFANVNELRKEIKAIDKGLPELQYPFWGFYIIFLGSSVWYLLTESNWQIAITSSSTLALSLILATANAHLSVIVIEIVLLILRCAIQRRTFQP